MQLFIAYLLRTILGVTTAGGTDGNGNGKMTHRGNPNLTHSLVRKKCFHAF